MADGSAENQPAGYVPLKVWSWNKSNGGQFASTNRPISGATSEKELPVGRHPLQLYSLGTPNGQKVTVLLEELLAVGHADADYDAWLIDIGKGDQFGSGFVAAIPTPRFRRWSTIALTRPSACSRAGPSCSIWRRSSAHFCLPSSRRGLKR